MSKIVNLALIASGGGTDANSIMEAWSKKQIPGVNLKLLVSTKKEAGCIQKAKGHNIPCAIIDRQEFGKETFNYSLKRTLEQHEINLVFLVGCIVRIPMIEGISFYNIHPANTKNFGGKGMYGLAPHRKVLINIKLRLPIFFRKRFLKKRFFTEIVVHEVNGKYDDGQVLLPLHVEIPKDIIVALVGGGNIMALAKRLQKHVLPYEHLLLPAAVNIAAKKLRDS